MKLYQYLYYRLYSWNIKTWGNEDMPQWNALYGVSFMMFLNLGLIALLLQSFGIDIFSRESIPKKGIIIIALLILFINYFLFIKNKKYLSLKKKFEKENNPKMQKALAANDTVTVNKIKKEYKNFQNDMNDYSKTF